MTGPGSCFLSQAATLPGTHPVSGREDGWARVVLPAPVLNFRRGRALKTFHSHALPQLCSNPVVATPLGLPQGLPQQGLSPLPRTWQCSFHPVWQALPVPLQADVSGSSCSVFTRSILPGSAGQGRWGLGANAAAELCVL